MKYVHLLKAEYKKTFFDMGQNAMQDFMKFLTPKDKEEEWFKIGETAYIDIVPEDFQYYNQENARPENRAEQNKEIEDFVNALNGKKFTITRVLQRDGAGLFSRPTEVLVEDEEGNSFSYPTIWLKHNPPTADKTTQEG